MNDMEGASPTKNNRIDKSRMMESLVEKYK